jgi:hypothetical protein
MAAQAESRTLQASDTTPRERKALGRPSTFTPATGELICARLADGELLTDVCRTPGMPARQTVQRWRMRNPAFDAVYMRAREIGMESMSDDMLIVADDDTCDTNSDGTPNHASVNRARLMVDTRKFLLGKLAPRIYGDRVQHEHSGEVAHVIELSDRERMRRLASFMLEDAAAGVTVEGQATSLPAVPAVPDLPGIDDDAQQGIDEPRAREDDNV